MAHGDFDSQRGRQWDLHRARNGLILSGTILVVLVTDLFLPQRHKSASMWVALLGVLSWRAPGAVFAATPFVVLWALAPELLRRASCPPHRPANEELVFELLPA